MRLKFLTGGLALTLMASCGLAVSAHAQRKQPQSQVDQDPGQAQKPKINKAEEDAYKAINDPKNQDPAKQIDICNMFVMKFPMSRYLPRIYTRLVTSYLAAGQEDKMFEAADKALQLDQDNIAVLSILSMVIPRRAGSNSLDAAQQLDKAEAYGKHAIDLIATMPKPDDLDDAAFQTAKNEDLSMAHSGLGLVDYDRKKYDDAVNELTQAIQLTAMPDPVDYYILGNADMQTSHFKDAAAAYDKCSGFGALATRCKTNEAEAQKKASTELSAPRVRGPGMAVQGLAELESVLGHRFRDIHLLERALMHRSRLLERDPDEPADDNEKLEFLGDSVLELVVREELVHSFPHWREGELSKTRTRLVNKSSLSVVAHRLDLGRFLRLGRGEEKTGGRLKPALLADAYEAVVAALYLDAGLEIAREFVRRSLIEHALAAEAARGGISDHKSRLQELLQGRGIAAGTYRVIEENGPDHRKTFRVEVRLADGLTAFGDGKTKKEAQQFAALAALKQLGAEKE